MLLLLLLLLLYVVADADPGGVWSAAAGVHCCRVTWV
jgi:hypothetical protein